MTTSRQRVPTSGRTNRNEFLSARSSSTPSLPRPKTSSSIRDKNNNNNFNETTNSSSFLDHTFNNNNNSYSNSTIKRPSTSIPRSSSTPNFASTPSSSRLGLEPYNAINNISDSEAIAFSKSTKISGEYLTETEAAYGRRPICHNLSLHRPRTDFVSTSSNLQLHTSRLDPSLSQSLKSSSINYNRTRVSEKARPTTANNPLSYIQSTSPRDLFYEQNQTVDEPLLPPSEYPLIPTSYYLHPNEGSMDNISEDDRLPGTKYVRPLVCPEDWLAKSQQPDLYEKSYFANPNEISKSARTSHVRSFIERNREELWKYNMKYKDETPRTICKEIVSHPNYVEMMTNFYEKERKLKLSSSKGTRNCLNFDNKTEDPVYLSSLPPPYCSINSIDVIEDKEKNNSKRIMKKSKVNNVAINADPFMASISTSRNNRENRIQTLLAVSRSREQEKYGAKMEPQEGYYIGKYARGFNHAHEYGTFSNFNAILKKNKATIINR